MLNVFIVVRKDKFSTKLIYYLGRLGFFYTGGDKLSGYSGPFPWFYLSTCTCGLPPRVLEILCHSVSSLLPVQPLVIWALS